MQYTAIYQAIAHSLAVEPVAGQQGGLMGFSPKSLFASGAQGAWYDPSDYSTMFEDSAGTIPITSPLEKPVGLMLDKSKGLVLGPEFVPDPSFNNASVWVFSAGTGVVTGGNAVWTSAASGVNVQPSPVGLTPVLGQWYYAEINITSISAGALRVGNEAGVALSPDFTTSGNKKFYFAAPSTSNLVLRSVGTTTATVSDYSIKSITGNHATQSTTTSRPTLSARYNQYLSTETLSTQGVTTLATNYTLKFTGSGTITLSGTATGVYSAGTHTITCTAGTLTSTVAGTVTQADLRVANDGVGLPAYQRVNTSTEYDYAGFPPYLKFDGTDDSMATGSIDFTGTDKMSVFAGVRKLSDAATGLVAEFSGAVDTNDGSFRLGAPLSSGSIKFAAGSKGTVLSQATTTSTTYDAPYSGVISCISSISGDSAILRINATEVASSPADQGTGNYGNYPLYIGRRGGSTMPFNGRLYSLVVCGKLASASEITSTESYINGKTKAWA